MILSFLGGIIFLGLAANAFLHNDLQAASLYAIIALTMETRSHLFRIEDKLNEVLANRLS